MKISSRIAFRLFQAACREIQHSHIDAIHDIHTRNVNPRQQEAKLVGFLCKAMADVAGAWGRELTEAKTGVAISMATVFTHQSPYVRWNVGSTDRRCELADVMLAIIDRTKSVPTGVAALIQAKISDHGSVTLSSRSEKTQFDLLSTRPKFDVDSVHAPKGIDLSHRSPDSALMYGLTGDGPMVSRRSCCWPHGWLTADDLHHLAGGYTVAGEDCLAAILVGMLLGDFGWDFTLPQSGSDWKSLDAVSPRDDWSTLINYLLAETFSKPLSAAQRISNGQTSRGREDTIQLSSKTATGRPMFYIGQGLSRSTSALFLSGDLDNNTNDWRTVSSDGGSVFDGDGGSRGDGDSPDHGPISAILFEVGG